MTQEDMYILFWPLELSEVFQEKNMPQIATSSRMR